MTDEQQGPTTPVQRRMDATLWKALPLWRS